MKVTTSAAALLVAFLGCSAVATGAIAAETKAAATATAEKLPRFYLLALRSDDIERSIKFYTTGLGMVEVSHIDTDTITEASFGFDKEDTLAVRIVLRKSKAANVPPIQHGNDWESIVFRVPDATAIATRLAAAGYKASTGPEHPRYKIVDVTDPDGHGIRILETKPAPAPSAK